MALFLTLLDRFKNRIFYERKRMKKLEKVEQRIAETPNKSIRRLTQETNLSFGTVQLILFALFSLSCVCCA
jgi:hypothetical protein